MVAEEGRCPPTGAKSLIFEPENRDCLTVLKLVPAYTGGDEIASEVVKGSLSGYLSGSWLLRETRRVVTHCTENLDLLEKDRRIDPCVLPLPEQIEPAPKPPKMPTKRRASVTT